MADVAKQLRGRGGNASVGITVLYVATSICGVRSFSDSGRVYRV